MTENTSDHKPIYLAWHIHHGSLLEPTRDLQERTSYVRGNKDPREVNLRLRLIKPVEGKLPAELLKAGQDFCEAVEAKLAAAAEQQRAGKALSEFERAHNYQTPTSPEDQQRLSEIKSKLEAAWMDVNSKSFDVRLKRMAWRDARRKYYRAIYRLHKQECPDCPWDGRRRTIFTRWDDNAREWR